MAIFRAEQRLTTSLVGEAAASPLWNVLFTTPPITASTAFCRGTCSTHARESPNDTALFYIPAVEVLNLHQQLSALLG